LLVLLLKYQLISFCLLGQSKNYELYVGWNYKNSVIGFSNGSIWVVGMTMLNNLSVN